MAVVDLRWSLGVAVAKPVDQAFIAKWTKVWLPSSYPVYSLPVTGIPLDEHRFVLPRQL